MSIYLESEEKIVILRLRYSEVRSFMEGRFNHAVIHCLSILKRVTISNVHLHKRILALRLNLSIR